MLGKRGFTLIELLVVLAIVATLLSIVAPKFLTQADRAREAALRENLSTLRICIDRFYADNGRYPERLEELVEKHYLRRMPVDPLTQRADSWRLTTLQEDNRTVIYDVASGATGVGLDGTPYQRW